MPSRAPVSLYDPVYTDGGDTLYVMDQISDKKNREDNWIEELSLNDAMNHLNERENFILLPPLLRGKDTDGSLRGGHISQAPGQPS